MSRRSLIAFSAVAALLLAIAGVAGAVFIGDGRPAPPPSLRALDLDRCRALEGEQARSCFAARFLMVVEGREALRRTPMTFRWAAATLGDSPLGVNLHVMLPSSIPRLIGALRITMVLAVNLVILAEFSVPVIFITAFPERLLTGTRPEPTFLITKPFQRSTVKAAIAQALFFDAATVPAA